MSQRREQVLDEMGLSPRWVLREPPAVTRGATTRGLPSVGQAVAVSVAPRPPAGRIAPAVGASAADSPVAERPAPIAPVGPEVGFDVLGPEAGRESLAEAGWDQLRQRIAVCRACSLGVGRTRAVPGVGDESADWLLIGEAPNVDEDAQGEPLVGAAGKLLDAMLAAIDLKRGDKVYITNAVKCRPPGDRAPEAAELAACAPFLARQIALLQPRLIVLLGGVAADALLDEAGTLDSRRGRALTCKAGAREIPVIVTYSPAHLLRTLPDKAGSWEDLCRARALMRSLTT